MRESGVPILMHHGETVVAALITGRLEGEFYVVGEHFGAGVKMAAEGDDTLPTWWERCAVTDGHRAIAARLDIEIDTDVFDPNTWPRFSDFTFEDWQAEVANGDTRLGYENWVEHQRESALEDENEVVDVSTCWVLSCVTPHDDVREVAVIKGDDEFDVEFCKRHREIHRPSLNPVHKKRLSLNVMTPILAFDLRGIS